eukprot:gene32944-44072_t
MTVVSAKGSASTSWPSSRPSSLFVAPTGPADETKPPTIELSRLKLPSSIVSSKNGSSSLPSLRSKSIDQFQRDISNPLIKNYNADSASMNAINSASY